MKSLLPSEQDSVVKLVVRVFIDAFPYIPEHRRLPLFKHLVNVLGPEQYFHVVIAVLIEKQIKQIHIESSTSTEVRIINLFLFTPVCMILGCYAQKWVTSISSYSVSECHISVRSI